MKNLKAKELINEAKTIIEKNKNKKILCIYSNGTPYNFNEFRDLKQFENDIFCGIITIKEEKDEQDKMERLLMSLKEIQ